MREKTLQSHKNRPGGTLLIWRNIWSVKRGTATNRLISHSWAFREFRNLSGGLLCCAQSTQAPLWLFVMRVISLPPSPGLLSRDFGGLINQRNLGASQSLRDPLRLTSPRSHNCERDGSRLPPTLPGPQGFPVSPSAEPPPGHGGPAGAQHLGRDRGEDGPLPRHGDALQQRAQVDVWDHGEVGRPGRALGCGGGWGWQGPLPGQVG